ncbi:MAG: SDR family NAD(P)-dependent oxidoreductase, partial [Faecalibacillus sp.]
SAVEEGDMKDVSRLFETNVWGPVALMKEVLPYMRKQSSGTIVNISSIAAVSASMGSGYYAASKSALESLSEALKKEVEPLGIKVMIVEPGAFRTDFAGRSLTQSHTVIDDYAATAGTRRIENSKTHGTQPGDPDKGAELMIKAVESDCTPLRLLLGSDAVRFTNDIMKNRQDEYAKWHLLSEKTDF